MEDCPQERCSTDVAGREAWFKTTHWSVVLNAGRDESPEAKAALGRLCQTYWYPFYVYVRCLGHSPEDAQDLTQEFFARLIAKKRAFPCRTSRN